MNKPIINQPLFSRVQLYTLYGLQCIAMENLIDHSDLDKSQLFQKLDNLGLLRY